MIAFFTRLLEEIPVGSDFRFYQSPERWTRLEDSSAGRIRVEHVRHRLLVTAPATSLVVLLSRGGRYDWLEFDDLVEAGRRSG